MCHTKNDINNQQQKTEKERWGYFHKPVPLPPPKPRGVGENGLLADQNTRSGHESRQIDMYYLKAPAMFAYHSRTRQRRIMKRRDKTKLPLQTQRAAFESDDKARSSPQGGRGAENAPPPNGFFSARSGNQTPNPGIKCASSI